MFIGGDCWGDKVNGYLWEDSRVYGEWKREGEKEGLIIKIGGWNIGGEGVGIVVDFSGYYGIKEEIYGEVWNEYEVDSVDG